MNLKASQQAFEIVPGLGVGVGKPLLLIAGPCQIESLEHSLKIAEHLKELSRKFALNFIFKSSFDKANRTSAGSKRGLGIEAGLEILAEVKSRLNVAVLTDVHESAQAALVAEVVDVLQIPAFLCRQTDLLIAAGNTGKVVNIKKGQFLPPEDLALAAEKVASTGNRKVLLCERGACFGYRDLVVDMRSLIIMRDAGYPVVFDASHSVQLMGGAGGKSGGSRRFIKPLLRAALAVGVDGIFVECHDSPDSAPSDGPNMVPLDQMEYLIEMACEVSACAKKYVRND